MRSAIRMLSVCAHCDDIFSERPSNLRGARTFCSRPCYVGAITTGNTSVELTCEGCGGKFQRPRRYLNRKAKQHYCSTECYEKHIDWKALGAKGGTAKHEYDPVKTKRRALLGGLARMRKLGVQGRHEFSRIGAIARLKIKPEEWRRIKRRGDITRRFGAAVALGVRLGKQQ